MRKGRRNAERRRLVPHSLLAWLKQLVDPILDHVVATLDVQCPDICHKEQTSFLRVLQLRDEARSTPHFTPEIVVRSPSIDAVLRDVILGDFIEPKSAVHGLSSEDVGSYGRLQDFLSQGNQPGTATTFVVGDGTWLDVEAFVSVDFEN